MTDWLTEEICISCVLVTRTNLLALQVGRFVDQGCICSSLLVELNRFFNQKYSGRFYFLFFECVAPADSVYVFHGGMEGTTHTLLQDMFKQTFGPRLVYWAKFRPLVSSMAPHGLLSRISLACSQPMAHYAHVAHSWVDPGLIEHSRTMQKFDTVNVISKLRKFDKCSLYLYVKHSHELFYWENIFLQKTLYQSSTTKEITPFLSI